MNDTVIETRGLGKAYRLGQTAGLDRTLREVIYGVPRAVGRWMGRRGAGESNETIWALRDVTFDVARGEVLGIIGANGAGKSTLLKVLSEITDPTEGSATVRGRVASLLEVGTGFHPELTGRENIFLNGAILGMTRREIRAKFDAIVDFAGIDPFLDTPVKRYSSGMRVRLAFAVAAHLDPEILIIDEVLAVGDAAFQDKCLGKMQDITTGEGRTVLFVSHNMAAVQRLCSRVLLMRHGRVDFESSPQCAVRRYLQGDAPPATGDLADRTREQTQFALQLRASDVELHNAAGEPTTTLALGEPFSIVSRFRCEQDIDRVSVVVGIDTEDGQPITTVASEEAGRLYRGRRGHIIEAHTRFDDLMLNEGTFGIRVAARHMHIPLDLVRNARRFEVGEGRADRAVSMVKLNGTVRTAACWEDAGHERTAA